MNCATNLCTQGRQPCPTPWECGQREITLHRVTPAQVTDREFNEITIKDEPTTALSWALFIVVAAFALGVVVLPFVLGAV